MTTEEEVERLRVATREAHEAMKDMKALMKEAREVMGEMLAAVGTDVDERIEAAVADGLKELGTSIEKATDDATEAVYRRFDQITDILLGEGSGRRKGEPSIPELLMERQGKQ